MKHSSLNHAYRLVWSDVANAYVPVAEHTAGRGKKGRGATVLIATALLGSASLAHAQTSALPTAGKIAAGQGSIAQSGSTMTVTQGSDRMVVNWNSFDIGAQSGVRFVQPASSSVALNRVTGGSASSILGTLSANGQVWLINPSGVVFGSGAQVDVGGLVASSLSLSDGDFLAGRNRFISGTGAGAVVNQGRISATGGVVALLAPQVRNVGAITTTGGSTVLAAGDAISLDFSGDGLVSVKVDRSVLDALAENSGRISADGGMVVLSARSANKALDSVVNNTGVIEAKGLVARNGRILLDGDVEQGGTHVSGTLDVSSATGQGGTIVVTGRDITLDHGATLDASGATGGGSIQVGGGFQGKDASVANATNVNVDSSVTARADATDNGNGGDVVFWSDGATRFAGNLSVRGGALGGDGGSIEVSGKQDLSYSGRADARAPLGRTGDLLLDPTTLAISGGGTGSGVLTDITVFEKDLEAQNANVLLQATGNVTINDLNLNGGDGTISMANNVSLRIEGGTAGSGNITFNNAANTIETFGTGSLMFVAGALGTGSIVNVANLIARGTGTNPMTLPTHTVTSVGSGTPGDASITLYGADGVTVGGSVTTNGGYVRVWADSDNMGGGGYTMSAPVVTNGGNFYVSAGDDPILLNSNMTLGAGRILFAVDGSHSGGARTLGGVLSASGAVNVSTPFTMNAGSGILTDGVITFSNTVNLNTGAGALTLRASAINFTAATLTNLSTASLILQPANPATSMVLGDANGFASAATLAKLPGVLNLTIGRTDGTGTTSVASNFTFAANGMLEIVNRNIAITGGTLTNTAGNVTLTGDNVDISRQVTSNAGNGAVTIRQLSVANPITLGSGLPNSAIGQINAATLVIGRSNGGDVTFATDIATSANSVHLLSGGQVTGTSGGVSAANLAIEAGGGATITSPTFNFSTLALAVGGNTTVNQTQSGFNIGAVDGLTGLAINTGTNANVTLTSAGSLTATGTLALNANTSLVTLNAANVILTPTVSGITNASFALQPLNANDNIVVGGGTFASAATLLKLNNSRNVTVGRSDGTGQLQVTGNISQALSGALHLIDGQVSVASGNVTNTGGGVRLTSLAGNLTLNRNVTAGGQLTLSATGATVGGSGNVIASSLLIDAATAAVALNAAGNSVGTIAGNAGSLSFIDSASLVVGTVGGINGVNSAGSLFLRTTGAATDLTLNQAVSGSGGDGAVVLASGRNFINGFGASAVNVVGPGRWLVYSGSPLNDTRGGLVAAFKQYNANLGDTLLGTGNGFVYRVAPVVTVALAGTTGKVYDSTTTATLAAGNYTTSGRIDGDAVTFTSTGATYATKGVGTGKSVTASGLALSGASNGGVAVYGYQLASNAATAAIGQITPATLTVGATTVADKVYNGNTVAAVSNVATSGVFVNDSIGTTATGAFANKTVGNGKTVTISGITLTGGDAGNYVLNTTSASGIASITPATLTVTSASVADKVYDTTTNATLNSLGFTGRFGSDAVQTAGSGAFSDPHVGTAKPVSLSNLTLTGNDAINYVLDVSGVSPTATITPALVTVGAPTITNKVYDATNVALVSNVALSGVYGSDTIGTTATGTFGDKAVGNGKAVAVVGIALTGSNAGDYALNTTTASGSADITPATLIVVGTTIANKVYDSTTVAAVSGVAVTGVIGNDVIATSATGAFVDKNVGNGKAVTVSGVVLTGADAGNYVVATTSAIGSANITPAMLTVGASTIADKVYDSTTVATVSGVAVTGVIGNDVIAASATGAFADKNVGNGKAVAVSGVVLNGADAGNYVVDRTSSVGSASITPAMLTVGASTIADKVYDTTTVASISGVALTGVFGNDVIGTTATGAFADKNVGDGKAVTVSGVALTGSDAGNYVVDRTSSIGVASITPATLTVGAASVSDKVYDATTLASISGIVVTGVLANDVIGTTATGAFADKNVGNGKAVTVGSVTLTGADAGNYVVDRTSSIGSANITPAMLNVGAATIANKVYDATTAASVGGVALAGVLGNDVIGTSATGVFADKNVGDGKAVTVSGVALTGADAGNYVVDTTRSIGSANITPATLGVGMATIANKVYDATTLASVSGVALVGVLGSDIVATNGTGAFADKNVGTGKAVTVGGLALTGADAGNYVVGNSGATGFADISPATLVASGANIADKAFDGNTSATVGAVNLSGILGADRVVAAASGSFADPDVGVQKPVAVSGITLGGIDSGNYALASAGTTGRASITMPVTTSTGVTSVTSVTSPETSSSVLGATLAALTSPQLGSNATNAGTATMYASDAGMSPILPVSFVNRAGDLAGGIGDSAFDGVGRIGIVGVTVPDTVLTSGGRVSIALGESDRSNAVATALPVYSVSPGAALHSEGQYIATDRDGSLSLLANGDERLVPPSLTQSITRSAEATVPLSPTTSVTMHVDLLADDTLVAFIPASSGSEDAATLAVYGLVVAKKGFSIGIDDVRAVVLRFEEEPDNETTRKRRQAPGKT